MSQINLTTPEGYFENSFERTMLRKAKIDRRRKAFAGGFAAFALLIGISFAAMQTSENAGEKEYYAMEMEMAQLDIFLEVNDNL